MLILALLVLMLAAVPSPIPLPAIHGQHAPVVVEQQARDLERDVNADRERQNLPALQSDERLHAIALDWALHMANQHFFGHFDFDGRGLVDRLHDASYTYHFAAENLSLQADARSANTALMNSEGHAANILSPAAKRIGVAAVNIAPLETIFVEDFSD
jgi:uncharacterized protein YkwD